MHLRFKNYRHFYKKLFTVIIINIKGGVFNLDYI